MTQRDQARLFRIFAALYIPCTAMGQWLQVNGDQMFYGPEAAARWILRTVSVLIEPKVHLHHSTVGWLIRQSLIDAPVVKRKYHRRSGNAVRDTE
jgi:hypothetical protein